MKCLAKLKDCEPICNYKYKKDGFLCGGIDKNPPIDFDVVKMCFKSSRGSKSKIEEFWLSPDEALDVANVLSVSVKHWLLAFPAYKEFWENGRKRMSGK